MIVSSDGGTAPEGTIGVIVEVSMMAKPTVELFDGWVKYDALQR